jgi:hypothetical protein
VITTDYAIYYRHSRFFFCSISIFSYCLCVPINLTYPIWVSCLKNTINLYLLWQILNKSIILPILLFIVMISKKIRIKQMSGSLKLFFINIYKINFLYYSVSCFLYYCIIFLIYLSTPNDLTWHLSTSAYRVMMPIGLMLTFYSFFDLKKNYKFFSL